MIEFELRWRLESQILFRMLPLLLLPDFSHYSRQHFYGFMVLRSQDVPLGHLREKGNYDYAPAQTTLRHNRCFIIDLYFFPVLFSPQSCQRYESTFFPGTSCCYFA